MDCEGLSCRHVCQSSHPSLNDRSNGKCTTSCNMHHYAAACATSSSGLQSLQLLCSVEPATVHAACKATAALANSCSLP